jgi:hypothetical protein
VKQKLADLGFVELVIDMFMGRLCSRNVLRLLAALRTLPTPTPTSTPTPTRTPTHSLRNDSGAVDSVGPGGSSSSSSSSSSSPLESLFQGGLISDLEKEDWFGAFALLGQLIIDSDVVKVRLL